MFRKREPQEEKTDKPATIGKPIPTRDVRMLIIADMLADMMSDNDSDRQWSR